MKKPTLAAPGAPPIERRVFPEQVFFGSLAEGTLAKVERVGTDRIARYDLEPVDEPEYAGTTEALRGLEGLRFLGLPGYWTTYQIVDKPNGDDRLSLFIGMDEAFLKKQIEAMADLCSQRETVVPTFLVRALGLGYLSRVGV